MLRRLPQLLVLLSARRSRGRALLSVLGIALGVALGYGVDLVNRAAVGEVAASVRELAGEADLEVRSGGRAGFPESLYPQVARVPGVALVAPRLEIDVGVAGAQRTIRVIGVDALREAGLRPAEMAPLGLLAPDQVYLSPEAARLAEGATLKLAVGTGIVPLSVAGELPVKGIVALVDIATAQWRLERLGELNRLDVRVARGANPEAVRARIAALLPPGVFVSTIAETEATASYPSRAYRVNLNVLALVALLTGGFLVFSSQALEAARRRGEHALLRVLGVRRVEIAALALLEAVLLGAAGGSAGIGLGFALAELGVHTVGADLGAGTFSGLRPDIVFEPVPAALYFAAGIAIALVGALLPALDAAARPPARALKAGDEQVLFERVAPAWPGLVLLCAGAALAQLGPLGGLPVFGYAAIASLLLGAIALMPFLSRIILKITSFTRPIPVALAVAQLRGAPGQAAVSLAAIVASFSLLVAMAVMVASFRQSVDDWLEAVLPAELYVRAGTGDSASLGEGFEERVRALPNVARVDFLATERIALDPTRPPVVLIARDRAARSYPMVGRSYERQAGDPPAVWVSETVSDTYGFFPGKKIELPVKGQNRAFVVVGIFRDYARQHGAVLVERADYLAMSGARRVSDAALWFAPGTDASATIEALRALPGGERLEISTPGRIRELSLRIFDRSFAVTYAMEAVALLVGLFGLSSSLGAIVLGRRREFGVLRHLGVTRGQIAAMLGAEGGMLALLGAAAGLAAGGAISVVLVRVVNRQSFGWGMELHPPFAVLAALTFLLIALSCLTAVLSGRQAVSIDSVRAVKEDW
jgi:putative ABC transport system permease protein